jgi:hypothetical protein
MASRSKYILFLDQYKWMRVVASDFICAAAFDL